MDTVRGFRERAVRAVTVPKHVVDILVDLRTHMQEQLEPPAYISDRRLVKAVDLMKVSVGSGPLPRRLDHVDAGGLVLHPSHCV